jgi:hypothetical protein
MMRVLEWNDPRARYPNLWHAGMPRQVLAFDTVASRLRLGDLIAIYHPASQRHPERAARFVGIGIVVGLRRSNDPGLDWVDLEVAHRFDPPLDLHDAPRRVFLCCDPGWPAGDTDLFRRVERAALAAGWRPPQESREAPAPREPEVGAGAPSREAQEAAEEDSGEAKAEDEPRKENAQTPSTAATIEERSAGPPPARPTGARLFGGADYSGDMRDPREGTWLALLELSNDRLEVVRLEATGRHGLQMMLRDADTTLLRAEAIGLDFPFGLPIPFAEHLLGKAFTSDGWWALARRLEKMSRPDYLVALQEFRDANGEIKRLTDEAAGAFSPLHRVNPDLAPMTYHGIRMMAEERSRYAIRPFESARGRLLLEVYPGAVARRLLREDGPPRSHRLEALVTCLERLGRWPVDFPEPLRARCLVRRDALDAVVAARCAAVSVLTGETEKLPESLTPEQLDQVHREGWIYGLSE